MIKKKNFITGAACMASASVLCKMLSAVFKIPLDRFFLHEEGIAIFQSAYFVYNLFLAVCVTGIPIALSSLVASSDDEEASSYCKSTMVYVSVLCVIGSLAVFIFARKIALLISGFDGTQTMYAIKMSAVAILFLGVIAALRGFFQGRGDMVPSSVSQIFESLAKALFGTLFCALFISKGIEKGAMGAMGGVSLGAVLACIVLCIFYFKAKPVKGKIDFSLFIKVIKFSIPVTLGAFAFTGAILTDTLTYGHLLSRFGSDSMEKLKLFGYLTRANTVYNLPATVITAVTASIVPAVTASYFKGEKALLDKNIIKSLKMLFIISSPCAFGLMMFSGEILNLLYSGNNYPQLLFIIGILVFIIPYVQATNAMLQSMGNVWKPILFSFASILVKIILNIVFIPRIGIIGAPLSTAFAFLISYIANTKMLSRSFSLKGFLSPAFKITISGFISCLIGKGIYMLSPGHIMLILSIGISGILYIALVFLLKGVTKEEIKEIRGGN